MYNTFSTFYIRVYKILNKRRKQTEMKRSPAAKVTVNAMSEV